MLSKVAKQTQKTLSTLPVFPKSNVNNYLNVTGGAHENVFNYGELESGLLQTTPHSMGTPTIRPTK